jgi:hypothetical protein
MDFFRNEFAHSLGPRFTKDDDMDFMIKENVISDSLVSKINSAIDAGDYEERFSRPKRTRKLLGLSTSGLVDDYTPDKETSEELFDSVVSAFDLDKFMPSLRWHLDIKVWHWPSTIHADNHFRDAYTCVIPLKFTEKTEADGVIKDDNGHYFLTQVESSDYINHDSRSFRKFAGTNNVWLERRIEMLDVFQELLLEGTPIPWPDHGLALCDNEYFGEYALFRNYGATYEISSGSKIEGDKIDPLAQPFKAQQDSEGEWRTPSEAMSAATEQFGISVKDNLDDVTNLLDEVDQSETERKVYAAPNILLGHNSLKGIDRLKLKHVLPWKIGAASLHRPTYMHCATDWSKIGTEKRHVFFQIKVPGYDK